MLIIFGSLCTKRESEYPKITHEALFIFTKKCLSGRSPQVLIDHKIEIFAQAKIGEIRLIKTGSSLKNQIWIFFSKLDQDKRQEKIFFVFINKPRVTG